MLPPQSANAHSKIESCSKIGIYKTLDKIKYICVKKNNKKLWVKAPIKILPKTNETLLEVDTTPTSTPTPTATPTPTPTSTPTPTVLAPNGDITYKTERNLYNRYKNISNSSANVFEKWRDALSTTVIDDNVTYSISPRFTDVAEGTIKKRISSSFNQLNKYATIDTLKIFIEAGFPEDVAGICDRIALRSKHMTSLNCSTIILDQISKEPFVSGGTMYSEINFSPLFTSNFPPNASITIYYVLADEKSLYNWLSYPMLEHEYFHAVQRDEGGVLQTQQFPCWLQEGSASYFSLLISTVFNPDAFTQYRSKYYPWINHSTDKGKSTPSLQYLRNWIETYSIKYSTKDGSSNQCSAAGEGAKIYSQGALLTEWMVGKIGFINFFTMMREVESIGFEAAFEKQFTKSLEMSYDEMLQYLYNENNLILENYKWLNQYDCYYFLDEVNGFCTNN